MNFVASSGINAIYVYVAAVGLLLAIALRFPAQHKLVSVLYILSSAAFLTFNRWPIFQYDLALNPDEALMAANAMKSHRGWLNWDIIDPLTAGPLASSILSWPYLLGWDVTLFSARITGAVLAFGTVGLLFIVARRLLEVPAAMIATYPFFMFFGAATFFDVVHYSSEHLPIFLIAFAICAFALSFRYTAMPCLYVSALLLGIVPYAKLQGIIIAGAIGCFVVFRGASLRQRKGQRALAFAKLAFVAAIPTIVFLLPLVVKGEFDDFIQSYILQQRSRITEWVNVGSTLFSEYYFRSFARFFRYLLTAAGIALALRWWAGHFKLSKLEYWLGGMVLIVLPVTYATIIAPGRAFYHYNLFAIPTGLLLSILSVAMIRGALVKQPWMVQSTVWILVFLVISRAVIPPGIAAQRNNIAMKANGAFRTGTLTTSPRTLQWLDPAKNDRLVCWGWRPECYVDAALPAATREATNENQLYETTLKDYFRERFLKDFNRSKPDFLIDVVAPGSFGFQDVNAQSIKGFPALAHLVENDFDLLSKVSPADRCPRLYVRKSRVKMLEANLIVFAKISASASQPGHDIAAIDDRSIFETCHDYWLLPDGQAGRLVIDTKLETVRRVAILNTRNGPHGDRSTGTVRLSFERAGQTVQVRDVKLRQFPHWTMVTLERPVEAERFWLEVLDFEGAGAGLNEIKLYRE